MAIDPKDITPERLNFRNICEKITWVFEFDNKKKIWKGTSRQLKWMSCGPTEMEAKTLSDLLRLISNLTKYYEYKQKVLKK